MSVEENKALVKRFFEAVNRVSGDPSRMQSLIDDFVSPEHIAHSLSGDRNLEQTSRQWGVLFSAFPDLNERVDDIVAEGDKVVVRLDVTGTHKADFRGIPSSGKQVRFAEASILRVAEGKILEDWNFPDLLGLMQQLGAIPSGPPKK